MGILVRLSSSIIMGILVRLSSSIWVYWSDSVQVYGCFGQTQFKYMGILVRLSSDRYIYTYYILELSLTEHCM